MYKACNVVYYPTLLFVCQCLKCFPCCYVTEVCLISADPGLYTFINQGVLTVDSIDDVEEMRITDVSSEEIFL